MKAQIWFCEHCNVRGTVQYKSEDGDVFSVIWRIDDDHKAKSPSCTNEYRGLRILGGKASPEEFARVMAMPTVVSVQ